jgi:hypothetical protein
MPTALDARMDARVRAELEELISLSLARSTVGRADWRDALTVDSEWSPQC